MRFDLVDLRLFLSVAEAGSITAGAARANLALASASERIRAMEAASGAALLERRHRGVALTPAGEALSRHARDILDACERMRGELSKFGRGLKGHVRMMANTSALSEYLPVPLGAFLAENPHVDIELEEAISRDVFESVAAGRVDLGVASDQVEMGEVAATPLRRDALVLVTRADHPLAARPSVAFAETLDHAHVGLGMGGALQDYLAGHARRLGGAIALRVRVRGFDAVCRMAEQGVGVGIVPEAAARRAERSMAIAITPLSDPWATRTLVIATRKGARPSSHALALLDWLTREQPAAT